MASSTISIDSERKDREGLSSLRPYLSLLKGSYRDFSMTLVIMAISTGVSLAIPVHAGRFVDALAEGFDWSRNLHYLGLLCGLLVLQLGGTYLYTVISARLGLSTITRLRRRLFTHLLELPSLFFTGQKGGDLSARMTSDVGSIQYLMTSGLVTLARAALTLTGAVALMFHLNVRLTLVILVLVPSTILLVQLFGNRLRRLSRKMFDELGQISSHVQEIAGAIRVIKVYNNQPHEQERFDGMLGRYRTAGIQRAATAAALESGTQILLWICLIAVVVYGFYLTSQGVTSYGELVAFFLLAYRVAVPMGALTGLYSSAQGGVAAASRLDDIFATPVEQQAQAGKTKPDACQGALTLEKVSFAYNATEVIKDISLEIAAGEWVGIVGPSGAGKTTLSGLVLRLFDPQQGRLLLDGRPFTDFDLTALREQMAFVSQEPVLYDTSIQENIRFGLKNASDDDVRTAAAQANALEFIEALPDGFETHCGERGIRLSGGERQRITLARAFLRNPRILVLDEPTSALDARSEEAVRNALTALMKGRTAIVIAHRLSLVRDLDRIFVVADGRLVEQGNHHELMSSPGLYNSLVRLQHGG
ncbi:MAG: ABC transporter ATP-binding protein [bacterium]